MAEPDHPDTPPPVATRAQLHAWLDTCHDEVAVALWTMVYWLTWPVGRREGE